MVAVLSEQFKFIIFRGTFVDTPQLSKLRVRYNTTIGVSYPSGEIAFIKENSTRDPIEDAIEFNSSLKSSEVEIVDCDPYDFFLPGFIDTHIHASQYPNNGLFGKTTLLDWLSEYTFPLEASLSDLKLAKQVYTKVVDRTLANGTTTAAYYTTIDINASKLMGQICAQKGQRAFIGKVCMDTNGPDYYIEDPIQSLKDTEELITFLDKKLSDPKVRPILTPRFAPACSSRLMSDLSKLAKRSNLHIQTHLSENVREVEWVRELFPDYRNYTDVYKQHGILTERTILAHCIYLSDGEIEDILKFNSGVSHCPISNSSLTSGECKVKYLLNKGVKVGLGTDISAGYSCSILETARHAHLVSRHLAMKVADPNEIASTKLSVIECLYLATQGGANTLNMSDKIGTFDVGKQFDAQLINLQSENSRIDVFPWQVPCGLKSNTDNKCDENNKNLKNASFEDYLAKWFFNGDDRNISCVWVAGSIVHSLL